MVDAAARLTTLTRLGFAVRGLLYIVIAFLVLTTGRTEDPSGALRYLGEGGGKAFLILVILGLLAYGLWRLFDAFFDIEGHGADGSGARERLGAGGSGFIHLFLAWQAVRLIQGSGDTGNNGPQEGAQSVLQMPGGGLLLVLGGLILLGAGIFQLMKAYRQSYLEHLDPRIANESWVQWSGRFGYAARGVVFVITAFFIISAGLDKQSSEAGGMADALSWLNSPWDVIVAIGLLAFGIFSLIEARYRILHAVPVHSLGRTVRSKFG